MRSSDRAWGNKDYGGEARRFGRSSWIVLAYALVIVVYETVRIISMLQTPNDGWLSRLDLSAAEPRVVFEQNFRGGFSPLQQGDELVAVEGRSLEELADQEHAFYRQQPPNWPDGTHLRYTVRRDDQIVEFDVPIARITAWEYYPASIRVWGTDAIIRLIASPFFFAVGAVVFMLRPGDRPAHALFILGTAFLFQIAPTLHGVTGAFYRFPPPSVPFDYWMAAILPSITYLMLAFPAPRWPVRRFPLLTPVLLYLWAPLAIDLAYLLNLDDRAAFNHATNIIYSAGALGALITVIVTLVHATLRLRGPIERAQLKWLAAGVLSFMIPGVGGWFLGFFFDLSGELLNILSIVGWFLLPVCLAIAITRYRLFDIEVIIRRTLVYTTLTVLLGAIYLGSVVLLQRLLSPLVGENNQIAMVGSTLAIAALFQPLRRRIQAAIDRRFYRRKYNAARIVQAFSTGLRDEVDIGRLSGDLVDVVEQTLQPSSVSLWLRVPDKRSKV